MEKSALSAELEFLNEFPEAFRFSVTVAKAIRCVRNADTCSVFVPGLGFPVRTHKDKIISQLNEKVEPWEKVMYAFDGSDMTIVAIV